MVFVPVDCVSQAVVAYVNDDEQVFASDGFVNQAFGFPCAKARALTAYQIGIQLIAGKKRGIQRLPQRILAELYNILVHFLSKLFTGIKSSNLKRRYWKRRFH